MMIRPIGGFRTAAALATLTAVVGATISSSSALAAPAGGLIASSSLFSIRTASGSLAGADDRNLTLRLTGTHGYLIRFTDRPLPQAFVVTNVDFAPRFKHYFAGTRASATLTYTPSDGRRPVSVGLTVGRPRWDAHRRTWVFAATRIRTQVDNPTGGTVRLKSARVHTPRYFTAATLMIDDSQNCDQGIVQPYEDCHDTDLAFVNLTGADLTGVNFSGANLTGANLTGADLTGADLTDTDLTYGGLTGSDLTGADLSGADLSGQDFIGANLHDIDLAGANLTSVDFPGVNLTGANLVGANLSNADLMYADLIDADITDADINGADFRAARFCGAILPQGGIGGGC